MNLPTCVAYCRAHKIPCVFVNSSVQLCLQFAGLLHHGGEASFEFPDLFVAPVHAVRSLGQRLLQRTFSVFQRLALLGYSSARVTRMQCVRAWTLSLAMALCSSRRTSWEMEYLVCLGLDTRSCIVAATLETRGRKGYTTNGRDEGTQYRPVAAPPPPTRYVSVGCRFPRVGL